MMNRPNFKAMIQKYLQIYFLIIEMTNKHFMLIL